MDPMLKRILDDHCSDFTNTVSDPCSLLPYLVRVLPESDIQKIKSTARLDGSKHAAFELHRISITRGNEGFFALAEGLLREKNEELALNLLEKIPDQKLPSFGSLLNSFPKVYEQVSSILVESTTPPTKEYGEKQSHQCNRSRSQLAENLESSKTPTEYVLEDTLVKRLPYQQQCSSENRALTNDIGWTDSVSLLTLNQQKYLCDELNRENTFGKDWRAIADYLQIPAEQQRALQQSSKMAGLFDAMRYRLYTMQDLSKALLHIGRKDLNMYLSQEVVTSEEANEVFNNTSEMPVESLVVETVAHSLQQVQENDNSVDEPCRVAEENDESKTSGIEIPSTSREQHPPCNQEIHGQSFVAYGHVSGNGVSPVMKNDIYSQHFNYDSDQSDEFDSFETPPQSPILASFYGNASIMNGDLPIQETSNEPGDCTHVELQKSSFQENLNHTHSDIQLINNIDALCDQIYAIQQNQADANENEMQTVSCKLYTSNQN